MSTGTGHWKVDGFRLFERPARPPPIYVAASGRRSAELAGAVGDGMIGVTPGARTVDVYRGSGGIGPVIGQVHVCLADTIEHAVETAWHWWPNGGLDPQQLTELARPKQFAAASDGLRPETIHRTVVCAGDAAPIIAAVDSWIGAGHDRIYLHQIGPDQCRLADLCRAELLPHYAGR